MDELRQFWITVGEVLDDAALTRSTVRLSLSDGQTIEGIPDRPAAGAAPRNELDETGLPPTVAVGGETVELKHVTEIVLVRPPLPPET